MKYTWTKSYNTYYLVDRNGVKYGAVQAYPAGSNNWYYHDRGTPMIKLAGTLDESKLVVHKLISG